MNTIIKFHDGTSKIYNMLKDHYNHFEKLYNDPKIKNFSISSTDEYYSFNKDNIKCYHLID